MPWIEKEGRTVEEARAAAIAAAGQPETELEVEVIREGAKGLFGLGGEPALVRVRPRSEARDVRDAFRDDLAPPPGSAPPAVSDRPRTDEAPERSSPPPSDPVSEAEAAEQEQAAAQVGEEMVRGILERMGLQGEVSTRVSGRTVYVEVSGEEMGILIGRGGATLEALQEIVRAGVRRRVKTRQPVVVDVESYWERRRGRRGGGRGSGRGQGSDQD